MEGYEIDLTPQMVWFAVSTYVWLAAGQKNLLSSLEFSWSFETTFSILSESPWNEETDCQANLLALGSAGRADRVHRPDIPSQARPRIVGQSRSREAYLHINLFSLDGGGVVRSVNEGKVAAFGCSVDVVNRRNERDKRKRLEGGEVSKESMESTVSFT